MYKSRFAQNLAVGSFVNLLKVTEFIKEIGQDFVLICAGRANAFSNFSLEDTVCAGMMVHTLMADKGIKMDLTDSALACQALFKTYGRSLLKMMKNTEHGRYLVEIGFLEDIKIAATVNSYPILPVLSGNVIKLRRDDTPRHPESDPATPKAST
jgi:2-phosphosulfolactate phosphatase